MHVSSPLSPSSPAVEDLIDALMATGRYRSTDELLRTALEKLLADATPSEQGIDLAALFDGIGDAFYALDRDWRFTAINRAAEAYYGRQREALLGRRIWDVFPWSAGTQLRERYEEAMRTGRPAAFETVSVGIPGRLLEIRLFPYAGGLAVSFRDWTERRVAEEALRASEARLRLAVDAGRLAVWEYDLVQGAMPPSAELNELLGFPRDASPSIDELRAGYMPGERERVQAAGQGAIEKGERFFQVEYRYRRRNDGKVIWLLLRAEIHFDGKAAPTRIVGVLLDITDRKQAEEALRESQARLALATQAADLGVWDWDLTTNRMVYSDRARAIFGFPPEGEVTVEQVRAATHPDDLPRTAALAARALDPAVREKTPYDYRIVRADGSVRWVVAHGEAVFGPVDGAVKALRYVGTIQDVTERKNAEEALRETQARLSALADNLPLGVVYQVATSPTGVERRFLYLSKSCERVNGVPVEAVMADARALYDLIRPEDVPRMIEAEAKAIETLSPFDVEVGMRHARTGELRWFRIISGPRRLPEGGIVWDGIQIDVTEQRAAEAALRESEARVTALADNLPLGMVYQTVISPDQSERRFLYLSQSCERMNGITAEEAMADPSRLYSLVLPEHLEPMLAIEAESIREMKPFDTEVAARHAKTGEIRWYRLMSAPRRLSDGQVIWDGIQLDITARKRAEEARRRTEERLRTILNEMPVGVALARVPDGAIVFQNAKSTELLGAPLEARTLGSYAAFGAIHPDGTPYRADEYPLARTVLEGADIDQEEVTYRRADGRIVQLAVSSGPIQGIEGERYALTAFHDITERKKAEAHQRLLINELNHRVKNTLATVQSIAAQSFRAVESSKDWTQLPATRRAFEERLFALARAHDVLTRESWEGAGLREVVAEVIAPHRGGAASREPFDVEGPDLRLPPSMALSLAMALHELCTNAVKYGALGQPGGTVRIRWQEQDGSAGRELVMSWHEHGGPPVIPPTRRGFGTRLLERGLAQELGGSVRLTFDPAGLICTIRVQFT